MGSWGCPHEIRGVCTKVNNVPCDPGMKGCVLAGKYVFANSDAKNERLRAKHAREKAVNTDESGSTNPPKAVSDLESPG